MIAKRSARALAALLGLPSAAFALGLGDIHLLSPLNAPLDAEIELVDVAPDEANTVQVQLASRDTFEHYGLDRPAYLSGITMKTTRTPDGREVIKLKSNDPITEPFVTLLVEVNWSRGRLVREYTMLLDPPVYTPNESQVAAAPVNTPSTGAGAREGAIARPAPTPPAPQASTPTPPEPTASAAETPSAAPAPTPTRRSHAHAASAAAPAPAETGEGAAAGTAHTVERGETLSGIASGVAGANVNAASTRSWMLAIYQANPRAFRQNMNVLRSGAVLRIPEASAAAAIPPSEAAAEIKRQYAAWRSGTPTEAPAEPATEKPGRLKLVTPSQSASAAPATAAPPAPTAAAAPGKAGNAAAQAQAESEAKRLLELKNAELARMQQQAAQKQGTAAPAPPPPATTAPATATPPAAASQPPAANPPAATAPTATTEAPPPPVESAPPPPPAPSAAAAKPKPATSSGGSFLDTLLGAWWILAAIALAVIGLLGFRMFKARRASELDDSLGRLAGEAPDTSNLERISARDQGFAEPEPAPAPPRQAPARAPAAALPESAFLVEETGSHERPQISLTGTQPVMAPPKHVATDETISSETAINLDQGDPLAEADFHMAYGLYDQAADLIRIAISREPGRRDLKLKLLEVFFVWGNKEQFLTAARELAQSRDQAAPGEWEKILIMGKQLAPEDPLFSSGAAVTGAAAGGVDLDLEGGQSRVDFDLLGDVPAEAQSPDSLDLDIGGAVGDLDATAESQSGITDRNLALEGTLGGATGSTRQMTKRMKSGAGSTVEMEGPTVEQPQLAPQDNPTLRQKLENAMRQGSGADHTAELAIDDLGLDVGAVDTVDQPGIASAQASSPDAPTLVAGLDDQSRRIMEDAHRRAKEETGETTGAWQFDQDELEAALTQTTNLAGPDGSATSRLRALGAGEGVDLDVGDATGTHVAAGDVDLDVGLATGTHEVNGGTLDLDVGTATVPDAAFAATQRLSSEDLALPDLEPVTMSEVGTKLDLARAYMDMGDPDGARNILEEVLTEGSAAQKQEAQRLIESLPG